MLETMTAALFGPSAPDPNKGVLNTADTWFAWHPVRLSVLGNIYGTPKEDSPPGELTIYFTTPKPARWAWWRPVQRVRGLYLGGPVYTELPQCSES